MIDSFSYKCAYGFLALTFFLITGCASVKIGNQEFYKIPASTDWTLDGSVPIAKVFFRVKEERVYGVKLEYPYDGDDRPARARLWRQVGGGFKDEALNKWVEPGTPIVVHVQVWQHSKEGADQKLIIEKEVKNPQLSSWGADSLSSELVRVKLPPGFYEAKANLIQGSPTLTGIAVKLKAGRAYVGK